MLERLTGLLASAARSLVPERLPPYAHPAFSLDSDAALRRCLDRQSREAAAIELTDWQRVNWLREWVYRHVPDASFSRCLDAGDRAVYDAPLTEILRRLAAEQRGFKCAGAALMLYRLCELFGYRAAVYNMGDPEGSRASHSVTLVEVPCAGEMRWAVLDPYFNHSLVDGRGQPIDVRLVIDLLVQSRRTDIRIATRRSKRLMVMMRTDTRRIRRLRARGAWLVRSTEGVLFCTGVSTLGRWMRDHPEVSAWMADQAVPDDPLHFLLFPLNIHGDDRFRVLPDLVIATRSASGCAAQKP